MKVRKAITGMLVATVLIVASTGSLEFALAQKLTKEQAKQCELLYYNYKKFGEKEFLKRYSFKSFIKECIKLYKDPNWTFKDKEKIDKYFDDRAAKKLQEKRISDTMSTTEIKNKIKVNDDGYMVNFVTCNKAENRITPKFLISSEQDKFIGSSSSSISTKSCKNYCTTIKTKLPNNISIVLLDENSQNQNFQIKKIDGRLCNAG